MTRAPLDFYPTRSTTAVTHLIDFLEDERLLTNKDDQIYEPCAGASHIVDVFKSREYTNILTNDIDLNQPTDTHHDALTDHAYQNGFRLFPLIVTNPPYSIPNPNGKKSINVAHRFVEMAFHHSQVCALLLRKSFTEPCKNRVNSLQRMQPHLYAQLCLSRISFNGAGKDTMSTDWFIYVRPDFNKHLGLTRIMYYDY